MNVPARSSNNSDHILGTAELVYEIRNELDVRLSFADEIHDRTDEIESVTDENFYRDNETRD